MLRDRLAVTVLLLPVVLWVIGIGGWVYSLAIALVLALAAAEYVLLFRRAGQRPSMLLLVGGVVALAVTRALSGFALAPSVLTALCLLGMTWHLVDYERGAPRLGHRFRPDPRRHPLPGLDRRLPDLAARRCPTGCGGF